MQVFPSPTITLQQKIYFKIFNTICCISIQSMPNNALLWGSLHKTLGLCRHTQGPKLLPAPFSLGLFPVFLGAHVLFTIGPDCWMGPSVRPLLIMWPLICLDSVTNRGCKDRNRKHPSQSWGNWAHFYWKGSKSSASMSQASSSHLCGSNENMISPVYWIIFQDSTVCCKISVYSRDMFSVNSSSSFPSSCYLLLLPLTSDFVHTDSF